MEEEVTSLLCSSLGLLRRRLLFLLLLFHFVLIVVRRATLSTSTRGNARAFSGSLRGWLLLLLGSFFLWLSFLGASRFLATVGLWFLLLFLLGLLLAVLLHFRFFLRVGFGGGSAFGWLVLRSWLVFVAAAALFILFGDLARL